MDRCLFVAHPRARFKIGWTLFEVAANVEIKCIVMRSTIRGVSSANHDRGNRCLLLWTPLFSSLDAVTRTISLFVSLSSCILPCKHRSHVDFYATNLYAGLVQTVVFSNKYPQMCAQSLRKQRLQRLCRDSSRLFNRRYVHFFASSRNTTVSDRATSTFYST